jgi:hypothetical protein
MVRIRFYSDPACQDDDDNDDNSHTAQSSAAKKKVTTTARKPLVLVLGLRESERSSLLEILTLWGTPPELAPTVITNESGPSKERQQLYQAGGIFVVTSCILIVDRDFVSTRRSRYCRIN